MLEIGIVFVDMNKHYWRMEYNPHTNLYRMYENATNFCIHSSHA